MEARLIRYADDLVVMCRGNTERILKGTGAILEKLGLSLNEEKTRVVNTWKERLNFLGFTVEMAKSPRTGKKFPLIRPSKKAMAQIQAEIKALTCRRTLGLPKEVIIQKLNEAVRGWVGYFYYGNCSRNLVHGQTVSGRESAHLPETEAGEEKQRLSPVSKSIPL